MSKRTNARPGDKTIQVNGHTLELTSVDKVLFPGAGITKGDLIDYYRRIAPIMLPHLKDRPLTLQRFPNGIDQSGFYQKEMPDYFPDWIERVIVQVEGTGERQPQVICQNEATLVYLANQACITPHAWLSRADKLDYPDRVIFDLDPPDNRFDLVRDAAHHLADMLQTLGLTPFLMTTGSRGLHVVAPLARNDDFDTVRAFAKRIADYLAARHPDQFTTEMRKAARGQRLFLDYLRNAYAQNAAAPYAVRAKPGAPIATPLDWHEIDAPALHSQRYTLENIFRRLGQKEDPWANILQHAGSLRQAEKRLDEIAGA